MEDLLKFVFASSLLLGLIVWVIKQSYKLILDKDFESYKNKLSQELHNESLSYKEKINLYKEVSKPIVNLVIEIEHNKGNISNEIIKKFDYDRLYITTQLSMFSSLDVFDSYNAVIDYIYDSFEGKETYSYIIIREKAMLLLNDIRKDIGIHTDDVSYKGSR